MGAEYDELRASHPEEFASLQTEGKTATLASKLCASGKKGTVSFGLQSHALQRNIMQAAVKTLQTRVAKLDFLGQVEAILSFVKTKCSGQDVGYASLVCKQLAKLQSNAADAAECQSLETVKKYCAEKQVKLARVLSNLVPGIDELSLTPEPVLDGLGFRLSAENMAQEALLACAKASAAHKRTNLANKLEKQWQTLHEPILAKECQYVVDWDPTCGPCNTAGICICCPTGLKLKKLRNKFLATMKVVFHEPTLKQALAQGFIIVVFTTPTDVQKTVSLHISMMYWRPFRPTFHVIAEPHQGVERSHGTLPDQITVQATGKFQTEYLALAALDLSLDWSACFYTLEDNRKPL
eukprot:2152041-Amphidinium_carterae.1